MTASTMELDGTIKGYVDGSTTINQQYKDLEMTMNETSTTFSVQFNGSLYAKCLDGWITVTTDTPLSGSKQGFDDGPTAGRFSVTDGSNTVVTTFGPAPGALTVTYNGSPVDVDLNTIETQCQGGN